MTLSNLSDILAMELGSEKQRISPAENRSIPLLQLPETEIRNPSPLDFRLAQEIDKLTSVFNQNLLERKNFIPEKQPNKEQNVHEEKKKATNVMASLMRIVKENGFQEGF
jgi:hypothetical protein